MNAEPITIQDIRTLGTLLRTRRKELGLTQVEAAEIAGLSTHMLSDVETGKGNPRLDTLLALCDLFGFQLTLTR